VTEDHGGGALDGMGDLPAPTKRERVGSDFRVVVHGSDNIMGEPCTESMAPGGCGGWGSGPPPGG